LTSRYEARKTELGGAAQKPLLAEIGRGVEKESLRIRPDGKLAQTPHPAGLGSALTHPFITTDYSEALLEFITPVSTSIDKTLQTLDDIHRFTYAQLDEELLWGASMPCIMEGDESIPVARYGNSNVGTMKTVYRYGLGHRYGRLMQTISGIHYNFSMPREYWSLAQQADGDSSDPQDYITGRYLGLIRNFQRYSWLLIYLFGASPAVCKSFLRDNNQHHLVPFDPESRSMHMPWATALRMGDLGYQSDAQKNLAICYNNLDAYIETLLEAITQPHPPYEAIGVGESGHTRQLNTSLLQIENEFYSPIRPKRVAKSGETALGALRRGGIEYVEVRSVDVNPFLPLGIDAEQIRFLDTFLLFCLLQESPDCDDADRARIAENTRRVVEFGREPGLQLRTAQGEVSLREKADTLLAEMQPLAALLDGANASELYAKSHERQAKKIGQPELTPSAAILREMQERELPFFRLAMGYSEKWAEQFRTNPLPADRANTFIEASEKSRRRQTEIEAADSVDFETYLENYYRQYESL
jgi:glutamate--cysteine ligase